MTPMDHLTEESVGRIQPENFELYLSAKGWTEQPSKRSWVAVFQKPNEDIEVHVPRERDVADYEAYVSDLLAVLAKYERRRASSVLQDLLHPDCDVIRQRLVEEETADGTVPFATALEFYSNWKKALLSVAQAVESPQAYYDRVAFGTADRFFSRCRVGQTEYGSYVGTVICPLDAGEAIPKRIQPKLLVSGEETYFTRRVTKTLVETIRRVVTGLDKHEISKIVEDSQEFSGLSANLCEAIVEMVPDVGELDVSVGWAPILPEPTATARVRIQSKHIIGFEMLGRQLRPTATPTPDEYVGKITELRGKPGTKSLMEGEVILTFMVGDELLRAKVRLDPDDYQKAVDAHRRDEYVKIRATLERSRRLHQLLEVRQLGVISKTEG